MTIREVKVDDYKDIWNLNKKAETWARETGAAGIRLVSSVGRTDAHKFYEAMGYISKKEQKNFKKVF